VRHTACTPHQQTEHVEEGAEGALHVEQGRNLDAFADELCKGQRLDGSELGLGKQLLCAMRRYANMVCISPNISEEATGLGVDIISRKQTSLQSRREELADTL
jgi:hypothetical protein